MKLSAEIAVMLDADPVLAKSVVEVLGKRRAMEIFELYPLTEEIEKEADSMGEGALIQRVVQDIPLSIILAAYRQAKAQQS